MSTVRPTFIHPCRPVLGHVPPKGPSWTFEPKLDGWRWVAVKNGRDVRLYSKGGTNFSARLPAMVEALGDLPIRSAVLDGELVLLNADGTANFYELMAQMRTRRPDETRLRYYVFDLLHADGIPLGHLPYSERRRDLERLCRKSKVPCMRLVHDFPNGPELLRHAIELRYEGIVGKRTDKPYASGPCKFWVKLKNPELVRANQRRHLMFEGHKKPEPTENETQLKKKRAELARIIERLEDPRPASPGMLKGLRQDQALLEQQIAELERLS